MPEQLTLDVIDRPAAGVMRTMRRLREAARAGAPGLRSLIRLATGHFVPRVLPSPTPRRIAVLAAWDPDADVAAHWPDVLGPAAQGAREHWHVRGEVVRASFTEPWLGWQPETDGARPLGDDEPALILISGNLRAGGVVGFSRDAPRAVAHAFSHPGYLGGLGINSAPLNTTSCSAWRSYADARDYAFSKGRHSEAMRRDRADGRHVTEWFLRVRPLEERGTLDGRAPFGALLAAEPA
jgi:hypothetical protein